MTASVPLLKTNILANRNLCLAPNTCVSLNPRQSSSLGDVPSHTCSFTIAMASAIWPYSVSAGRDIHVLCFNSCVTRLPIREVALHKCVQRIFTICKCNEVQDCQCAIHPKPEARSMEYWLCGFTMNWGQAAITTLIGIFGFAACFASVILCWYGIANGSETQS
jgi:hypothetical protein